MFKRFKVTGINEDPKKPKRNLMKYLALGCVMALPAFALLKTGVLSMNKNVLAADKNKYDIVANLDGGKFEMGTTPEFTKMDNGNWLYKYKPVPTSIKLPVPVKDGYEFTGWTVSAKPDIQKEYSIPAWHKGNLNVKANWKQMSSVLLSGGSFAAKIRNSPDFENITHIKFVKGEPDPNGIDLSEKQDKSVMGSFDGGIFTIACRGEIFANPDSSEMFREVWTPSEITFDNFNTSNVTNMSEMFYVNFNRDVHANLIRIHGLEKFNTSKVTNMSGMFSGCSKVESLNLSSFNTSKVTNMTKMFEGCESIKTLDVSNFDTSQVMSMAEMFSVRWVDKSLDNLNTPTKLVEIVGLEDFNTSRVRYMTGMFANCSSIEALNVSNFDTSSVQDMNGMFFGCWALRSINLTNFDTSNVESMVSMFDECSSLTTIDVSNFNTSRVTNMSDMFATGRVVNEFVIDYVDGIESNLISIKGFENLNTSNVQYMSRMFCNNLKLSQLNLKNLDISKVEQTDSMFRQCIKLNGEIVIDNASISVYKTMFEGCASDSNAEFIVKYTSPETKEMAKKMVNTKNPKDNVYLYEDSSTLLDGPAFNTKIKTLSGYNGIEFIKAVPKMGVDVSVVQDKSISAYVEDNILKIACIGDIYTGSNASNMFKGMSNITDITFNNFNSSNATDMSYMFSDCRKLATIDLAKLNTSSVTNMYDMFASCHAITEFDLSLLDTSKVTSLHGTFYDCDGLTSLDLNQLDTSKVTDIGFIVAECDNLATITMDKLNVSNVTSIRHLFKYCRNLETVVLPKFDFSKVKDTEQAFAFCSKLNSSIIINGSATTSYKEMFHECSTDVNAKFIVGYIGNNRALANNMVNTKLQNNHVYLDEHVNIKYVFRASDNSTLPQEVLNLLPTDTEVYKLYSNNSITLKNPVKSSVTVGNNKYTFTGYDKNNQFEITASMLMGDSSKYVNVTGTWKVEATIPVIQGATLIPGPEFNDVLSVGQDSFYHMEFRKVNSMSGISGIDVSEKQDKSIIAYMPNSTTYYIVSTKKILANRDASYMFNTTYKTLQTLDLTNFDIGQSENIESMFDGQETLTEIKNIENMHTYHVKNMDSAFYYCSALRSLDLSKWNTANVTSMRGTFGACGASTINVANWNTSKCTNMRSTFMNMENLRVLDLSGWDTSKATDIASFISRSTNLTDVRGNIKLGVIRDAMWLIKEMPNIKCTITATETYNSSSFSSTYSGMIRNATSGSGRVNINYTSNAKTLANEIVSDSRYGSSPNVYLGSQVSVANVYSSYDNSSVGMRVGNIGISKDDKRKLNDYELHREISEKSFVYASSAKPAPTTYAAAHQNTKPVAITHQINITLNNGSMAMYPVQKIQMNSGKVGDLAKPDLNPKYAGQFGGYFYDKNCTIPVKPNDVVTQDIELYAKW